MTPAIEELKRRSVTYQVHEYSHDPASQSYGEEAAEKLGLSSDRVFKTLIVSDTSDELACAIVPVNSSLDMKAMAKVLKVKRLTMAAPSRVARSTGYVLGGVSPVGQKKALQTIVDDSASKFDTIFVSAGRRGLEVELSWQSLVEITSAEMAEIRQT